MKNAYKMTAALITRLPVADITLCTNQECISADFCERYTAKSSKRQSFAFFCGDGEGWEKCDHFLPNAKAQTFNILATTSDTPF